MHSTAIFTSTIMQKAHVYDQRTGQYLFNQLPNHIARLVSGTTFDPFHKDFNVEEIYKWINDHLIFNDNEIICLFNNDKILWEVDSK